MEKEKKTKKKKIWLVVLILLILLVFSVVLFLILSNHGKYTIVFDTDGGSPISSIEVKNGEIVKMPENPTKEGYVFAGWVDKNNNIVTSGIEFKEDLTIKALWISKEKEIKIVTFDTDGGNDIGDVLVEDGVITRLPMEPTKEGYVFAGWINEKNKIIQIGTKITDNTKVKAIWISKDSKVNKITFDVDGGSKVYSIIIENGKNFIFPVEPSKEGFVFRGWKTEKEEKVTEETIITSNMKLKAIWLEPYTCPTGCTPIEDGSKCSKTTVTDLVVYTGCPSGTETVERFCSAHKRQVTIGFDDDVTYEYAGILCNGSHSNFCIDYGSRYTTQSDGCPSGYFKYTYSQSGLDASYGCAKRYEKGGSYCPDGYAREGDKCTKTETIACVAN